MKQADKIATGHNADDIAETVLLNIVRGDLPRLSRCASIITGQYIVTIVTIYIYPREIATFSFVNKCILFGTGSQLGVSLLTPIPVLCSAQWWVTNRDKS